MENGPSEQAHALETDQQSERSAVLSVWRTGPLNAVKVAQFHLLKAEPSDLVNGVAYELT